MFFSVTVGFHVALWRDSEISEKAQCFTVHASRGPRSFAIRKAKKNPILSSKLQHFLHVRRLVTTFCLLVGLSRCIQVRFVTSGDGTFASGIASRHSNGSKVDLTSIASSLLQPSESILQHPHAYAHTPSN